MANRTDIDDLIAETQLIRDALIKTVGRLDAFSANLKSQAEELRRESRERLDENSSDPDSDIDG